MVLPLSRVWKFQRRARDYFRIHLAVGQRHGRTAFVPILRHSFFFKSNSKFPKKMRMQNWYELQAEPREKS